MDVDEVGDHGDQRDGRTRQALQDVGGGMVDQRVEGDHRVRVQGGDHVVEAGLDQP